MAVLKKRLRAKGAACAGAAVALICAASMCWPERALTTERLLGPTEASRAVWGDTVVVGERYGMSLHDLTSGSVRYVGVLRKPAPDVEEAEGISVSGMWGSRVTGLYTAEFEPVRVYTFDLSTKLQRRYRDGSMQPRLYQDTLVFAAPGGAGETDIFWVDLETGAESRLDRASTSEDSPDVWGDRIVFRSEDASGVSDIYCIDLTSGGDKRLTSSGKAGNPGIWGDVVVYSDTRTGGTELYSYDLNTDTETTLTTQPAVHRGGPDIHGTTVVFSDDRHGSRDLYSIDLDSGVETRLTSSYADEDGAHVWDGRIVYGSQLGVWLFEFAPAPWLGTPWRGPQAVFAAKPAQFESTLRPAHADGTSPVVIHLHKRTATGAWVPAGYVRARASTWSGSGNPFSLCSVDITFPSTGAWRLSAYVAGDALHASAWSPGYLDVVVQDVVVGTPNAPERMRDDTRYSVAGSLRPRHRPGTQPVRVYRWKKLAGGRWDPRGYTRASLRDYHSYSRYYARMSFPSPGTWRVRAFHPDDGVHRARWSAKYDYVKVTQ